jgi:hypothetical protein
MNYDNNSEKQISTATLKKILIAVICVFIVLAIIAVVVWTLPQDNNNEPCTAHMDNDSNNICDVCGLVLNNELPNNNSGTDYSTDVNKAIESINYFINQEVKLGNVYSQLDSYMHVKNVQVIGNLETEEFDIGMFESIDLLIDHNKVKLSLDGMYQYYMVDGDGIYAVATDGTYYDSSFNPFDEMEDETVEIPQVQSSDIVYDENSQWFVFSETYMKSVASAFNADVEQISTMSGKFRLDSNGKVCALELTIHTVDDEVVLMSYSIEGNVHSSTMKASGSDNATNISYRYAAIDTNSGTVEINVEFIPPVGSEIETQSLRLVADVSYVGDPLVFEEDVVKEMEFAKKMLTLEEDLEEKYADEIVVDNSDNLCYQIAIYDEEYDVYAVFFYSGYSSSNDVLECVYYYYCPMRTLDEDLCLCEYDGEKYIIVSHSESEILECALSDKYAGAFEAGDLTCDSIYCYDEEYDVYVVFEADWFNEGYYEYDFFEKELEDLWGDECKVVVDLENKTITLDSHSEEHAKIAQYEDITFAIEGFPAGTYLICVYDEELETYLLFYGENEDENVWKLNGTTSYPIAPTGVINWETKIIVPNEN